MKQLLVASEYTRAKVVAALLRLSKKIVADENYYSYLDYLDCLSKNQEDGTEPLIFK